MTLPIAGLKGCSISCFLPASVTWGKTWKPKTPATFLQTKTGIMYFALRSFYCRQIQRALISFQLPDLLTSSFSFSVWGLLSEMPISPLFQISAGTSGCCSQCPLNPKSFADTGRHPPISRSKCNRKKSASKEGAAHHCFLRQKWQNLWG